MELGHIFALLAAVSFSLANVLIRKGTFLSGESFTSVLISNFVGLLFFSITMLFTSGVGVIGTVSLKGIVLLSTGGILHFVAGRFLAHNALRLLGAVKASAIMRTQIFYPVILGVMLFNESLSIFLIVGVICLIIGATLVSLERKNKVFITFNYKGIIVACLAALCWGISGVVLKPGIQEIGSPFAALLVSNIATVSVMIIISLGKERQDQIKNLNRKAFITLATASLFTSLAQLGRYASLRITPVSVVDPLILSAYALLVIFLSFIINRQIEIFTWKVLVGSAVTVAGVILLIY